MAPAQHLYAIIAGVGGGTGRACALRYARTYPVVLLARKPESYAPIIEEIQKAGGSAIGIPADVTDPSSFDSVFAAIGNALPGARLAAAIYNVGSPFVMKPFLEQTQENLEQALGPVHGFFHFAQKTLPHLLATVDSTTPSPPLHPPTLILTGATASIKGSARFSTFAAGKFAQRAMCQSMAREFGPKGVHVAHAIIDGVIDTPDTKSFTVNGGVEDGKMNPEDIAETYWNLHTQGRSAFTQEVDLRPYVEKF